MTKKAQTSIEYLIVVSFVTFAIMMVLTVAYYYSSNMENQIEAKYIENFGKKLVSSSESVFYSGEPSKATVNLYLSKKVSSININGKSVIINATTSNGQISRVFVSKVELDGSIPVGEGIKVITLTAESDRVVVN